MSLKTIKTKIRSVQKTQTVARAMEAVSASKMRKSQKAALAARAYARAAAEVLARVSGRRELASHPLTRARPERSRGALYIVITSDKGLAGALNSGVLRAAAGEVKASDKVLAIGRKANDFFSKRGVAVEAYQSNTEEISAALIHTIVTEAASRFAEGAVDTVKIVYQNFVSTFEQRPTLRTIFPLSLEELERVVRDIMPVRGTHAGKYQGEALIKEAVIKSYTVEPDEKEVLNAILPKLAGIFVYHAFLESQASEHSARMVAMKSAGDKAEELSRELTLDFNKARQAAITREVSEIIAGTL